jgi:hypothetical protein
MHGDFDHTPEIFAAAKTAEETHTEADSLKLLARIGPTDEIYERGKSVELLLVLEAKSDLVNAESIARAA